VSLLVWRCHCGGLASAFTRIKIDQMAQKGYVVDFGRFGTVFDADVYVSTKRRGVCKLTTNIRIVRDQNNSKYSINPNLQASTPLINEVSLNRPNYNT
jgi:hypothetical protein